MQGWWCVRYRDALAWVEAPTAAMAVERSLDVHPLGDWTDDAYRLVVFPQDAYPDNSGPHEYTRAVLRAGPPIGRRRGERPGVGRSHPRLAAATSMLAAQHATMCRCLLLIVTLTLSSVCAAVGGQSPSAAGSRPTPRPFLATAPTGWSASEQWVWNQVVRGQRADFDAMFATAEGSASKARERFSDPRRRLTGPFLRELLTSDNLDRTALAHGLRISGASFTSDIDLRDVVLLGTLEITDSEFLGEVVLNGLETDGSVKFIRDHFRDIVLFAETRIGGNLLIQDVDLQALVARGATIDGSLSLYRSRALGDVDLGSAVVGGHVFLKEGRFRNLKLAGAEIGGRLSGELARIAGEFDAGAMRIEGNVLLPDTEIAGHVTFRGATIGGQLTLVESSISGDFQGQSLHVARSLTMRDSQFGGDTVLTLSVIDGGVDVGGATFNGLDLSNTVISKDLWLATEGRDVRWRIGLDSQGRQRPPFLGLRGTSIGGLVDSRASWPDTLGVVLKDFTYKRWTPLPEPGQNGTILREPDWYIGWLGRDATGSFQPYRQLARTLDGDGAKATAREVLIAGRERERRALPRLRQLGEDSVDFHFFPRPK